MDDFEEVQMSYSIKNFKDRIQVRTLKFRNEIRTTQYLYTLLHSEIQTL